MHRLVVPTLVFTPIVIGVPIYVYTSYVENQKPNLPAELFCVSETICEGSAANCRSGSAPLHFKRGDDFDGEMQFDNGRKLTGAVTAVAGQMSGRFNEPGGGTYEMEISTENFTLMHRVPDVRGTQKETYFQGTCERVN
ncbi:MULTISPECIES: hypothetical protein [Pacificibacter]|uniref:hypothetical protein n=1 Tax=Pacificibacter TaxID=1042323 RepID=UPI001C0A1170|nr:MULTISPECIES: hypothetical protein [Pacificibacter]MBU2936833.1 hypothetical protein [Pacificibacter marinus]MDO6614825.1 hypothetical protein [Pacificibacter sp. 1_MG-2023]